MKICFPNPLRLTSGIVLASALLVPLALAVNPQSSAPPTPTISAPAFTGGVKAVKLKNTGQSTTTVKVYFEGQDEPTVVKLKPGAENSKVITQYDSEHNLIAITKVETTGSVTTTFP